MNKQDTSETRPLDQADLAAVCGGANPFFAAVVRGAVAACDPHPELLNPRCPN